MRRADRLFQILQILRRSTRPVTAARLAEELEVSTRTIYRDIADLAGQRIPLVGEAGSGYILSSDYDMPPLMFTAEELEAVFLGAELVRRLPDATLANNASDVLAKIASVIPARLLGYLSYSAVGLKPDESGNVKPDTRKIRTAIREGKKILLEYGSASGDITKRTIWPVMLGYDQTCCLLIGWCELRGTFRHFRVDRIRHAAILNENIGTNRNELRNRWERWRDKEMKQLNAE
ncbi:YafY family protein [Acerihabitans sp. TG2]|uniref:helix-turn-helix transcriptional regulator n=1 Tax=Acerihabitans sp. TG2 TaxID=3096008 RepID=UPI002B23D2FC|nr:YafY family protein [Acerihabitans sp. TG2]MEA9390722.1 YafY family protein [Acerihabitans sp. TG2]